MVAGSIPINDAISAFVIPETSTKKLNQTEAQSRFFRGESSRTKTPTVSKDVFIQ
jgi:hypothetical protein